MSNMTFHESYGNVPVSILSLIRRYNVSPADFDLMTDLLGNGTWEGIAVHIIENSERGYYIGRTF